MISVDVAIFQVTISLGKRPGPCYSYSFPCIPIKEFPSKHPARTSVLRCPIQLQPHYRINKAPENSNLVAKIDPHLKFRSEFMQKMLASRGLNIRSLSLERAPLIKPYTQYITYIVGLALDLK